MPDDRGRPLSCFAMTEPGAGSDAAKSDQRAAGRGRLADQRREDVHHGWQRRRLRHRDRGERRRQGRPRGIDRVPRRPGHGVDVPFHPDDGRRWPAASLVFDDVRVPDRNVLGEVGQGFALGMEWIGRGRYLISARALGVAERYSRWRSTTPTLRETFGRKIGANQAIQWMIADSEVELEAARWLVLHAAWTVDRGPDATPCLVHREALRRGGGQRVVDRVAADPRRHGLYQGASDRTLVSRRSG